MRETQGRGRRGEDSIFDLKVNLERSGSGSTESGPDNILMLLDVGQLSRYGCSSGKKDGVETDEREIKWQPKFGSRLGITQRQLGVLASSVMPVAAFGRTASVRASIALHTLG